MTTIKSNEPNLTLINTFTVAPEAADQLIDLLNEATDKVMRDMPGFISANIHKSLDGGRVVNYAQWRSKEDFEAMRSDPRAKPHMQKAAEIADGFDPVLYDVISVHDS